MKKLSTLLFFAVSSFVIFSCNKKEKAQTQPYAINGVDDIYVKQGEDDSWNLEVRSIGPVYETVTLAVTGLPNGLTANISQPSGMPTFFSTVVFTNFSALPGSYPCVLTASSPEAGKSTYNFMVKISAPVICGLVGNFSATSQCDSNFLTSIAILAPPIEDSINTVKIVNFGNEGVDVRAEIDCSTSSVNIPSQAFIHNGDNVVISGAGTFNGNAIINITYNVMVNGGPATSCNFIMRPR